MMGRTNGFRHAEQSDLLRVGGCYPHTCVLTRDSNHLVSKSPIVDERIYVHGPIMTRKNYEDTKLPNRYISICRIRARQDSMPPIANIRVQACLPNKDRTWFVNALADRIF